MAMAQVSIPAASTNFPCAFGALSTASRAWPTSDALDALRRWTTTPLPGRIDPQTGWPTEFKKLRQLCKGRPRTLGRRAARPRRGAT